MKSFSLISAVLSAVVGVASAFTTPVNGPIGNPIGRPGFHEQVPVGKPYTITWNPNHHPESTVTLVLVKGPSNNVIPQFAIVEKTPNTGSYVWTPDTSFPDSKEGYGIQLIVDQNGDYQWSTQFGFSNPDATGGEETTTAVTSAATTTTAAEDSTTTEESDYPTTTTTEESDYPTTTTTTTTTEEEEITTTTIPANTTTTIKDTTTTTTSEAVETTTTETEVEEPTYAPTTLITITPTNSTIPPTNTSIPVPTQSDSGVGKNVASFGMALIALAVAGFSLF